MYKVKEPKSAGYLLEILKGLSVTMKHFIRMKRPTIQYPEERRKYSDRFRGMHILTRWENGAPKCVACYMCQTACPAECITIVAEESGDKTIEKRPKSFQIDTMRCIMCGFCVDACPKEALIMSKDFELATMTREDAVYDLNRLMGRGRLAREDLGYRPYYDASRASGKPVFVGPGPEQAMRPEYCALYGQKQLSEIRAEKK